jgi:hypothetical protein
MGAQFGDPPFPLPLSGAPDERVNIAARGEDPETIAMVAPPAPLAAL